MKTRLGKMETQLMALCQLRKASSVRVGDLVRPLRISAKQERELLSRMSRGGMIARVKRGLYLVPPRLPLGGSWSPDEGLVLSTLMGDRQGTYQVCGPSAFNRYGFDEQVATRLYVYNDRLSGDHQVGAVELTLIRVASGRLGSTEEIVTPPGSTIVYSSRARTLVDAVYDWSRFDSLPRGYDWIRKELAAGRVKTAELVRVAIQFRNQGTLRRIGALLELEGVNARSLKQIEAAINPSKSLISWVPRRPRRGRAMERWGVILNDD